MRAAVKDGPRLDLPMPFIPPGFEKLVEHGYGPQAETRREHVDDLRDAIRGHRRIILLGDPGSGKTTTLWRLAYDYATTAREDAQAPLPVLVPLGGYTDNGPFDACLAHHLGSLAPYLETYRSSGRLILLLDGLNEMPQADYTERVGHIQDVLNRYPDGTTVITCRALDYVVELKQLQKVEVSPLDETRMRDFLHNYLGETAGERLLQAMEQTGLRALGHNPYLLLMTAQVYAGAEGKLPANRAKLFSAFVDTLLRREEKRHPESWIEIEDDFFVAFQYALDDLVREDKRLVKLLDWAARKSAAVTTPLRHAALRSTCCQIALAIARGRTLVESGDIDYSYLFDRTRDQARALAHSLGYDQDCDRVPSLDLDFAVSYALTRALTCARPIVRGGRGTFVAAFSKAKAVSRENKAHDLYQALSNLTPPKANRPRGEWMDFCRTLESTISQHRDVGQGWRFTREQTKCLERYLHATQLLVQCLDLAHITDRAAVEGRLLLPPHTQNATVEDRNG